MFKREGARLNESFCPILECLPTCIYIVHIFKLEGGYKKEQKSILDRVNMMKNYVIYQSIYMQANTNQ